MVDVLLDDVKVIEYCDSLAGAYCAKQLADLGAEVIKIEKPLVGDKARTVGPFPGDIPHLEKSGLFLYANTNKLGITLEPSLSKGREIFGELVKRSDIIVEDNPPDHLVHMKLGYEEMKKLKPDIIMTSITPFGQTGPYAHYKAYALNVYHSSGLGHITPEGYADLTRPPVQQGKYVTEYHAGIGAALITMGVLVRRRLTGTGHHIDFSMQEWEMNLLKPKWEMFTFESYIPNRRTVVRQGHGMTPCKDGYVMIMLLEEHQWLRFVELADKPEWLTDERFLDPYKRAENGKALSKVIADWAKDFTMQEICRRGQAAGIPVGMVNKPGDLFSSQQLEERGFFQEVVHPCAGTYRYPGTPYKLSGANAAIRFPAPSLGQNNEEIYVDRLGYTKEDLVSLRRAQVI
jgi:CoA:oxalate CoA-transferase